MSRARPKHLDLLRIRLPITALVSILHRISGAILFLLLPFLLTLFELSLESAATFARFRALFSHWLVKLIVIGLLWAYLHHLFAGVRHLALDLDFGTELPAARASSKVVLAASLVLTAVAGALIW